MTQISYGGLLRPREHLPGVFISSNTYSCTPVFSVQPRSDPSSAIVNQFLTNGSFPFASRRLHLETTLEAHSFPALRADSGTAPPALAAVPSPATDAADDPGANATFAKPGESDMTHTVAIKLLNAAQAAGDRPAWLAGQDCRVP